jgi:hypothetical protein
MKWSPIVAFLLVTATLVAQDSAVALRRGFREVELGLPFGTVQELLAADPAFAYRGEPDVSMRISDGESVIDTRGRIWIDRGIFQFHDGSLTSITLYLDRTRLDYFQLYEQLRDRYGEATDLDPRSTVWEDGRTRIRLERPLTVSYLDLETYLQRRQDQLTLEAIEDATRQQFLEEF